MRPSMLAPMTLMICMRQRIQYNDYNESREKLEGFAFFHAFVGSCGKSV